MPDKKCFAREGDGTAPLLVMISIDIDAKLSKTMLRKMSVGDPAY